MRSVLEHLFIIYRWVLKENSYLRFSLISNLFITLQCRLEWTSFDVFLFIFVIVVLFILYLGGGFTDVFVSISHFLATISICMANLLI